MGVRFGPLFLWQQNCTYVSKKPMKYLLLLLFAAAACNESNRSSNVATDTMPTVKPKAYDTSRVVSPPPTGDSNVVAPDSNVESR